MNKKIYGDANTIKEAKAAKPGNQTVLVNWEAIEELPDQFEVKMVKVEFDPQHLDKFFTNVGSEKKPKWYPHIDFMYKIAEARGVIGSDANMQPIYEDIEIDELNMTQTGVIIKKKVGYSCKKSAYVLTEDGTERPSGERISIENSWENCVKMWHKEEKATHGYSPEIVKDGEYTYYSKTYTGKHYFTINGKYKNATPLKYDTKWKRQCSFDEELDKAAGKADSKSKSKAIREVVGLPTGFESEDLKEGRFIFAKIRRSREILQLETAANLSRISAGKQAQEDPVKLLFKAEPDIVQDEKPESEPEPELEPARDRLINALKKYIENDCIPDDKMGGINTMLEWLEKTNDAENNKTFWNKAIKNIKDLEKNIPEEFLIDHKLY